MHTVEDMNEIYVELSSEDPNNTYIEDFLKAHDVEVAAPAIFGSNIAAEILTDPTLMDTNPMIMLAMAVTIGITVGMSLEERNHAS